MPIALHGRQTAALSVCCMSVAKLKLGLQQRQQLKEQQRQQQLPLRRLSTAAAAAEQAKPVSNITAWLDNAAAAKTTPAAHFSRLPSNSMRLAAGATAAGCVASQGAHAAVLLCKSSRQLSSAGTSLGAQGGQLNATAPALAHTDALGLHRPPSGAVAAAVTAAQGGCTGSTGWKLGSQPVPRRKLAAAAAAARASDDADRAQLNVDELKHDLEACLRRVV